MDSVLLMGGPPVVLAHDVSDFQMKVFAACPIALVRTTALVGCSRPVHEGSGPRRRNPQRKSCPPRASLLGAQAAMVDEENMAAGDQQGTGGE